ncbi:MAG: hypothetical protein ACK55I_06590, partial [bacterium]
ITRPDDDHPCCLGQGDLRQRFGFESLPPEGAGFEVLGEDRCAHDGKLCAICLRLASHCQAPRLVVVTAA